MENVNTKRELARLDMIEIIVLMYNKTPVAAIFFSIKELAIDVNIHRFFIYGKCSQFYQALKWI